MRNIMKILVFIFLMLCVFGAVCVFFVVWKTRESIKNMKPYASYVALMNLADGFDYYKKQNGVWPTNVNQLINVRPELGNDLTDAYNRAVIVIPYIEKTGYGEVISYGQDGKPGGDNRFDRDIIIRFPAETETNAQWNAHVAERFKTRTSRGLW